MKTTTRENAFIWFGAGVSIAEILTGTLIAPLGLGKGFLAILLGHLIGGGLFFLAGLIGGKTGMSAMETVEISFGTRGSKLFSVLNVLQLVGWTAVMIVSGAQAAAGVVSLGGTWVWSLLIGALILVWVLVGITNLGKMNTVAMGALFLLTVVLSIVVFRGEANVSGGAGLSFGAAVELSVAMPLSWLPLVSDYTRAAKKPFGATLASTVTYSLVSIWMYMIGLGATLFTGETDIAMILTKAGLGVAALVIVIFSTVTTTFLDVYSAGVSCESISKKMPEKPAAIAVCVLGTLLAIFTPITQFESFLYLIGSVFAPMAAILITDYFILKKDSRKKGFDVSNLILWAFGFLFYRLMMQVDTPVGYTLPAMLEIGLVCVAVHGIRKQ